MALTAIEIIQEAAKRLAIMIPQPPLIDDSPDDTSLIDYDKNLLVSSFNSVVKQNMVFNLFNRQYLPKTTTMSFNSDAVIFLNNYVDKDPKYSDFVVNMTMLCPDFEEMIADGFVVSVYDTASETLSKKKNYFYRQLTPLDYQRLKRTCISDPEPVPNSIAKKCGASGEHTWDWYESFRRQTKDYKRNMPSEDRTYNLNATNKESGYIFFSDQQTNKIVYFCNNMLTDDEVNAQFVTFVQPPTLEFFYRTNYGIINEIEGRIPTLKTDTDTTVLPDEYIILGIIINFKTYYGMDATLELGQYKTMLDQMKSNQQAAQITALDKKIYKV